MGKNMKKANMDEIKKRVYNGLVTVYRHPFLNLYIYNYTRRTQYEKLWDAYTRICRGLIIDGENNILNNPFPKFYNLGETKETMIHNLPIEVPNITEKLDGMLGILYDENEKVAITTRGRFDSPYAKWATNWLRQKGFSLEDFKPDHTYLFEIIYPKNKIIVDYKNRAELVLLAVRNNDDGYEIDYVKEADELGLSHVKEFSGLHKNESENENKKESESENKNDKMSDALNYLKKCKGTEYEGFVCRYSNGLRVKIKSADYMRLHRLLVGLSSKSIWEMLRNKGKIEDILDKTPDEFYNWAKKVENQIVTEKENIVNRAESIVKEAKKFNNRAAQSEYIRRCTEDSENVRGVAFFLLDNKVDKAEQTVWKMVKPSGELFKIDEEYV